VTRTIGEGTVSEWLDAACEVIHVPGHSQDSIAFHFPSAGCLIGGDVLFRDGVGRTDLPDGDWEQLIHSITAKLFRLPGSTTVHPGHGPSTTIDQERHFNPFLKP
jgi:glyoxylase-like metal-dependent hydrolase (beta-lactamase superfamily II)